jgi:hypothetical protein
MKPLLLAAPLGLLLLFSPLAAQQSSTHDDHQHAQAAAPQASGMMDHNQMTAEMKAQDARLQVLTERMKSATGGNKVQAIEDVVSELVANQLKMHQHMETMHEHMMPMPNK